MSEFRQDPITGRWAIVAENRSARPNEYAARPPPSSPSECPFCEGHESWTPPEVAADRDPGRPPDGPGWRVRVVPNKFPTLIPSLRPAPVRSEESGRRPGHGYHEVVVAGPEHRTPLAQYSPDQVERVLRLLSERVRVHARASEVAAIVAFENCGPESGGTLFHPHLQLVALPEVPPLLGEEAAGLARFSREHAGACGVEWVVSRERAERSRLVFESDELLAFCPFASEHPYEVRIVPRRHAASLGAISEGELHALSERLPALLRSLQTVAPGASYNLVSRAYSDARPEHRGYHWHLDLLPRLVRPDGFEVGGGIAVNPVPPESAAAELSSALRSPGPPTSVRGPGPKI